MIVPLLAPLALALVVGAMATTAHRRLPAPVAARVLVAALVLAVLAALPTALLLAAAFLAHVPVIGVGLEWCTQAIGLHGSVPVWIGVPAVVVLVVGVRRVWRLLRDHRRLRCDHGRPVHIVDSDDPFAVTLPGAAGQILVSTALWSVLDERERRVVLAHERAHAHYRHDRFILVGELAAAVLPPLRWLSRRLTFTVERWADEAAARRCGDRVLVALTLGKVALASGPPLAAHFAGLGVAARMEALMSPAPRRPARHVVAAVWSALVVAAVATGVQLHHLESVVAALCPH